MYDDFTVAAPLTLGSKMNAAETTTTATFGEFSTGLGGFERDAPF
jgi:hypothetical protein